MQVFIIDDEEPLRDSLSWLLESRDISCKTFDSGESFLAELPSLPKTVPSCIILDIRMEPKMSGIEVFQKLVEIREFWPIIFLTGHGDVTLAVNSLKQGAFDFIEKPFADNYLVDRVINAISFSQERIGILEKSEEIKEKIASLSPREMAVMEAVLNGQSNREAAETLDMAVRTVEVHRANLFKKMGVKGAVDLINLLQDLEV